MKFEIGMIVEFKGTAQDLVNIFLEDVPVLELQRMEVVNMDNGTYDKGMSIYTDNGMVFPDGLLRIGGAE
tara:strand:- start:569 stop:778 length:210 start_codon:yes stop_codon:yes gene_type:complete